MKELLIKIFAVFAVIIFVSMLVHHGDIDFSAWDVFTEKTQEAVQSEQGQAIIKEVKDTSVDVGNTFWGRFKKDAAKIALQEVTLIKVVDGDTLIVSIDGKNDFYVRLIGIDTPESVNPDESKNNDYGKLASDYTKALLNNVEKLYLQYDKEDTDNYGRTLAYVWLKNDVDMNNTQDISNYMLNGIIIRNGYAIDKMYAPNVRYADVFAELREDSQQVGSGLWSDTGFIALWQ